MVGLDACFTSDPAKLKLLSPVALAGRAGRRDTDDFRDHLVDVLGSLKLRDPAGAAEAEPP